MVEEDHQLQYAIMKSLEDQVMDEKIGPGRENRSEEMYIDQEQIQLNFLMDSNTSLLTTDQDDMMDMMDMLNMMATYSDDDTMNEEENREEFPL